MTENKPARKPPKVYSSGAPKLKRGRKATASRTSAAKVKRKEQGLNPPKSRAHQAAGHASDISGKLILASPERVHALAQMAVDDPDAKRVVIKKIQSQEQRFLTELKSSLISAAPRAAAYLSDLVDGVHESAPHAVRAGAASKIIDSALELAANGSQNKDLAEMTHEEIQAELRALTHALGSQSAEDAEIIDDQAPAAARVGRRSLE